MTIGTMFGDADPKIMDRAIVISDDCYIAFYAANTVFPSLNMVFPNICIFSSVAIDLAPGTGWVEL